MNTKGFKRKLSAILSADVVGYSRLMGEDEEATVRTLRDYEKVIFDLIERHNGRLVDSPGDNVLAEFASVVDAVRCAIHVQKKIGGKNEGLPTNRRMDFRIGVNIGDVIQQGDKIYGDGVNVAARIEPLADPGGICVSRTAYDQVKKKLDIEYEYLGEYEVKNIDEPVRIYKVVMEHIPDDLLQDEKSIEPVSKKLFGVPGYLGRKRSVIYSATILLLLLLLVASPIYQRLTQDLNTRLPSQDLNTELPSKILLAILPFQMINLTGDSIAFAKGLIVTMNAQLTKLTGQHPLQVVSPSEIREKNIQKVQEAYSELGANIVMEGNLQQFGEEVRIDYVMVDAKTKEQLRGDVITAEMTNPFGLMDRIVASVLSNLEVYLRPEEERSIAIRTTQQPEAYNYYLTAIGYLQDYHKSENVQTAIKILQHALEQDPEFAEAYAALGESLLLQYRYYEKETKRVEEALSACNRALELDSNLASGHVCLGNVFTGKGKYEEAVEEFQRALESEPANDEACRGLGSAYEQLGLFSEAEKIYKSAIELKPEYWAGYNDLGDLYVKQGRFSEAAEQFSKVTKLVPGHHIGYSNLGGVYLYEGRYSEAIAVLEHSVALRPTEVAYSNLGTAYFYLRRFSKAADAYEKAIGLNEKYWILWGNLGDARYWDLTNRDRAGEAYRKALILGEQELQVNPRDTRLLGCMAYYHAMLNEKEAARNCMKRALAEDSQDPVLFFNLAQTCYRLGDTDQALDWLKKAMAAGLSNETIQNTPLFDPLRNSQAFQGMLQDHSSS
jgi:adenylate cyclase